MEIRFPPEEVVLKVTGDEEGVRSLKNLYSQDRERAMTYLRGTKRRGVAYYRSVREDRYVLYEIRYQQGDVYQVSRFQEGSLSEAS